VGHRAEKDILKLRKNKTLVYF